MSTTDAFLAALRRAANRLEDHPQQILFEKRPDYAEGLNATELNSLAGQAVIRREEEEDGTPTSRRRRVYLTFLRPDGGEPERWCVWCSETGHEEFSGTKAARSLANLRAWGESAPPPTPKDADGGETNAAPWDEKSLDYEQPLVRLLLRFMKDVPREARLETLCPAVWGEEFENVKPGAIKLALWRANKFLGSQPSCRRCLSKPRGEPVIRWD